MGEGTIEPALKGAVHVLRMRFKIKGKLFEGTYVIDSDLDNLPRLTGYVYRRDGTTKRVGLEAMFADQGQLEHQ